MAYDEDEVDTAWDALEEALEQCAAKVASDNQVDNGYFVSPNPRCFKVLMAAGLRHVPLEYLTVLLKEYLRSRVAPQFCATVAAGGKQVKTSGSSLPRDENDEEASRGSWGASSEVNQLQQEAIARAVATAECCLSRALIAVAELLAAINEISSDEERQTHLVKSSELRTLKQELRQELATAVFKPVRLATVRPGETLDETVASVDASVAGPRNRLPLGAVIWMLRITMRNVEGRWNRARRRRRAIARGEIDETKTSDDEEEPFTYGDQGSNAGEENDTSDEESSDEDEDGDGEGGEGDNAPLTLEPATVQQLWRGLRILGWLKLPVVEEAVAGIVFAAIEREVSRRATDQFAKRLLARLTAYGRRVVLVWLRNLHGSTEKDDGRCSKTGAALRTGSTNVVDGKIRGDRTSIDSRNQSSSSDSGGGGINSNEEWAERVDAAVHDVFCRTRIDELFDIIHEFPDSELAVLELRTALEVTQQHGLLASVLRDTLQRRLLHPGAMTTRIIEIYISTIKVLRLLDPSDAVLDAVATPVRSYLQRRKDTVRCIVTSLTDENADLYNELKEQQADPGAIGRSSDIAGGGTEDDEDEDGIGGSSSSATWQPRARNTDSVFGGGHGASGSIRFDILGMLISIYGSKELFVKEYRHMLASKLIKNLAYDTSKDLAILERLKLRFGEASMQQCDIMVKDVDESKRLNVTLQGKLYDTLLGQQKKDPLILDKDPSVAKEKASLVDATIVSEHFWPALEPNNGTMLHPSVTKLLETYNDTYSILKQKKQLQWRDQLGLVELELEFPGAEDRAEPQVITFSVSPIHATLILHFHTEDEEEDKDADGDTTMGGSSSSRKNASSRDGKAETPKCYRATELAMLTGLPVANVRHKMKYWVNAGVVLASPINAAASREPTDQNGLNSHVEKPPMSSSSSGSEDILYTAQEVPLTSRSGPGSGAGGATGAAGGGDEDDGYSQSAMASSADDENLKVIQNFIKGMLKNFNTMPLDRIHNMLKMYTGASDTKYDKSTRELGSILSAMVTAEEIDFVDGQYKFRKPAAPS